MFCSSSNDEEVEETDETNNGNIAELHSTGERSQDRRNDGYRNYRNNRDWHNEESTGYAAGYTHRHSTQPRSWNGAQGHSEINGYSCRAPAGYGYGQGYNEYNNYGGYQDRHSEYDGYGNYGYRTNNRYGHGNQERNYPPRRDSQNRQSAKRK